MIYYNLNSTEQEWAHLKEKMEKLYPGRSMTFAISAELRKHIKDKGGYEKICAPCGDIEVRKINKTKKIRKSYRVPSTLIQPLTCLCSTKEICIPEYITRFILHPHLDK